jgi:hypothetical protein
MMLAPLRPHSALPLRCSREETTDVARPETERDRESYHSLISCDQDVHSQRWVAMKFEDLEPDKRYLTWGC